MADNRKLWESLGIDLKKHDQLLEVLPQVFGDLFLSQEGRPSRMAYFDGFAGDVHGFRIRELVEHKQRGGKVFGAFCIYVPEEVIYAAGGACVGLCGGVDMTVAAAERILPRNLCPLIKSSVGFKLERLCPYVEVADLVVGETTCDGKKKAWELLSEYVPLYVMELPQKKSERDLGFWEGEIWEFLKKVQEVTGKEVTAEGLREAMEVFDRKRQALQRLFDLRRNDPVPISGLDALLVVQLGFLDDPVRFSQKVEELCEELQQRAEAKQGAFPKGRPRILVAGSPMVLPNWKLHALVEKQGGVVVCEESCTGTRLLTGRTDPSDGDLKELIKAIARRQFKANCACFTPNEERVQQIVQLCQDYRVHGVIYYSLVFCQPFIIEGYKVERALRARGIPVLRIESDYGDGDLEALKTRVKAFLEGLA